MNDGSNTVKRVRPAWLDGPLVVAGNWEPLIFRRRLGGGPADLAGTYAAEHTAAAADALADAGVNLMITHWQKGFGLAAEAADMAAARALIGHCHDRGIRVAGYVGDTFIAETLLAECPDCRDWCQQQPDGTPVEYSGIQTWRLKWCRENPAFLPWMKEILRLGIDAGLDMIHFDNFLDKPEPLKCRCRHCTAAFRAWLRTTYTEEERTDRFGHAAVEHVDLPRLGVHLYAGWARDRIQDPLRRAAVAWRCASLVATYRALGDYCRSLKPDIVVECNPTGIWGENSAYLRGVDHARLLPLGDLFWDESPNPHGLLPNGALSTNLRSMKLGEATGNRTLFYAQEADDWANGLKLGEALAANNGCLGRIAFFTAGGLESRATARAATAFLHAHANLLVGSDSLARVAVYRQFTSLAADAWEPQLQTLLAEQTLLQGHVPFAYVLDLADARRYDAVILAGLDCLDDGEAAALADLAAAGTAVIAVGEVGTHTAAGRRRAVPALPDAAIPLPRLDLPPGAPTRAERRLWDGDYPVVDARFWGLPPNASALLEAVPTPLAVEAPPTVLVEPRRAATGALVLHVLNYAPGSTATIRLPAARCRLLAPGAEPEVVPADTFTVHLPYTLALVENASPA